MIVIAMDGIPLTQLHLDTLSTDELVKLSDTHGVDIPPGLDRVFIIEQLLELAALETEIEEEYTEVTKSKFPVSAVLPKQYNITFLETLVRDPLWVYVFWEIKGADRDIFEKASDFDGYFLKVSPFGRTAPEEVFTVPLTPEDNARYLGFPPPDENQAPHRGFTIGLFAKRGGEEISLITSDPFVLPILSPRSEKNEETEKPPLIRLSGIEDFNILRNGDRNLRIKS